MAGGREGQRRQKTKYLVGLKISKIPFPPLFIGLPQPGIKVRSWTAGLAPYTVGKLLPLLRLTKTVQQSSVRKRLYCLVCSEDVFAHFSQSLKKWFLGHPRTAHVCSKTVLKFFYSSVSGKTVLIVLKKREIQKCTVTYFAEQWRSLKQGDILSYLS